MIREEILKNEEKNFLMIFIKIQFSTTKGESLHLTT